MIVNFPLRRLAMALGVCLLGVCLLSAGCKRRDKKIRVQQTDEDSATLASMIHMGDAKAAPQLLKGFYNIEEAPGAGRWASLPSRCGRRATLPSAEPRCT